MTFYAPTGLGEGRFRTVSEDAASTTTEQIKQAVWEKLLAAIDGVCAMGNRKPKTVTLTIDAFSFLVAEATWETSEACR